MEIAFDFGSDLCYPGLQATDLSGEFQAFLYHPPWGVIVVKPVPGTRHRGKAGLFFHGPEHRIPVPSVQEVPVEAGVLQADTGLGRNLMDSS